MFVENARLNRRGSLMAKKRVSKYLTEPLNRSPALTQRGGHKMKILLLALCACLLWQSDLAAQTPFYQGQTVTIRVGFTAGGAFDVWARIIAQHLGKYVTGNPTFVVQNMTGGGSMIAANYIYSVAKPDGLTLGVVSPGLYIQQLSGQPEIKFEWFKYSWIGSPEKTDRSSIFGRTLRTKLCWTCAMPLSRLNAPPRGLARRPIISPDFSRKLLASN